MCAFKIFQHIVIVLFFVFMITACPFIETEEKIKIVNDSGSDPITSVNIDNACSNGWSGERSTNIPVNDSQTFEVDAGDYDIRACKSTQSGTFCTIWHDEFVDWDETVTFDYSYGEDYTSSKQNSC